MGSKWSEGDRGADRRTTFYGVSRKLQHAKAEIRKAEVDAALQNDPIESTDHEFSDKDGRVSAILKAAAEVAKLEDVAGNKALVFEKGINERLAQAYEAYMANVPTQARDDFEPTPVRKPEHPNDVFGWMMRVALETGLMMGFRMSKSGAPIRFKAVDFVNVCQKFHVVLPEKYAAIKPSSPTAQPGI
jgi:hypothetical protein